MREEKVRLFWANCEQGRILMMDMSGASYGLGKFEVAPEIEAEVEYSVATALHNYHMSARVLAVVGSDGERIC